MEGGKKISQDNQIFWGIGIGFIGVALLALAIGGLVYWNSLPTIITPLAPIATSDQMPLAGPETDSVLNPAINTFELKKDATICKDGNKPVIYLFSTTVCPHCLWIKPVFDRVVAEYVKAGKITAYHYEFDIGDNTLTPEIETVIPAEAEKIYQEFNPNDSVPTFVFGCKYFRVSNGYEAEGDLVKEEQELRAVIDDLLK